MAEKETKNNLNSPQADGYKKPQERLDVQTVVTDMDTNVKTYLDGVVADFGKVRAMTGANRFTVKVMVAFKVLGVDDKYRTIKFEYYPIQ